MAKKKTHVFFSACGFVGLWDGSTKMTEIFQRYLWDMWDMEKLCGTVGWLEKKTPGFFFSLRVCVTVRWVQKNKGNISAILVGYVGTLSGSVGWPKKISTHFDILPVQWDLWYFKNFG